MNEGARPKPGPFSIHAAVSFAEIGALGGDVTPRAAVR